MSSEDEMLSVAELAALREAIATAVMNARAGLGGALESDPAAYLRLVVTTRTAAAETSRLLRESIDGARHGWHTVDHGTLFHLVETSPWRWEHRRVLVSIGARRNRLHEEGWQLIKHVWFPWAYYERQLEVPAEPEQGERASTATAAVAA